MAQTSARTEFSQALKTVATERGLDASVVLDTIKQAIIAAYKRDARDQGIEVDDFDYDVELHSVTGETKVFAWPLEKPEEKKDVTPPGFGRIAAQTAKQVIHQKIREAEKDAIMEEYKNRVGTLISGMILRFDGSNVRVDIGKTEAIMPSTDRIPNERLNLNQRLTFLLKDIVDGPRGKEIVLSRAEPDFVTKLFAREVPEIGSGSVVIRAIAREAGVRTKIAVHSDQSGVDPVGSCVGQKGVRVQAVTNELGGERVDIIAWTEQDEDFIKGALSPAEVLGIKLSKKAKEAKVKVPEDQLSLAIGKDGQNVRLASKITGWTIEVEGVAGVKSKEPKEETEKVEMKEDVTEDKPSDQAQETTPAEEPKEEVIEDQKDQKEEPKGDEKAEDQTVKEKAES